MKYKIGFLLASSVAFVTLSNNLTAALLVARAVVQQVVCLPYMGSPATHMVLPNFAMSITSVASYSPFKKSCTKDPSL